MTEMVYIKQKDIVLGVILADYYNNGYVDLAATQAYGTNYVLVYLNNGDGTFPYF